jgi:hypothetical protein
MHLPLGSTVHGKVRRTRMPSWHRRRSWTPSPKSHSALCGGCEVRGMSPPTLWHPLKPGVADVDPHAHTPVEILHVLLLGVVRYFWRDAVARLTEADKQTVITRLSCLDVAGLGHSASRIAGRTFVQYAGSLVGRDFRIVVQLAIFTLYDLLPPPALRAWAALCALVPMIWQPHIEDADVYLVSTHPLVCLVERYSRAIVFAPSTTSRQISRHRLHIYLIAWLFGHPDGSTSRSSTYSCTYLSMSGISDPRFFSQQRPLNPTMLSSEAGASTRTGQPRPAILLYRPLTAIESGI